MIALCIVGGPPLTGDTLVVGPRCGLPVFARSSAWTSIPFPECQFNDPQLSPLNQLTLFQQDSLK